MSTSTSERNPEVPIPKHATWAWRPRRCSQLSPREARPVISRDEPNHGARPVPQSEASTEILRGQMRVAITKELKEQGFQGSDGPERSCFSCRLSHRREGPERRRAGRLRRRISRSCVRSLWLRAILGLGSASVRLSEHQIPQRDDGIRLSASVNAKIAFRAIGNKPVGAGLTTFTQSDVNSLVGAVLWKLSRGQVSKPLKH